MSCLFNCSNGLSTVKSNATCPFISFLFASHRSPANKECSWSHFQSSLLSSTWVIAVALWDSLNVAGEWDSLLFTMTSNACKHTKSLISFSLSAFLCVSKSLSAAIYALSHTPRRREKHIVNELILNITLWFQQLGWLCACSGGKCLAAQLCDFSTRSSVWSKWVNSWDLTILKTIAYWSSFLWQTLCCALTE